MRGRIVAPFAAERAMLDAWAVWRDNAMTPSGMGIQSTPLAGAMELGLPVGAIRYRDSVYLDDTPVYVDRFMIAIQRDLPKAHLALEARHRRVVGAMRLGLKHDPRTGNLRPYRDRELAEILLGSADAAGVMRLRRLFEDGYDGLRSFLHRGC